ncbi:putative oxidoreductase [Xylaria flabelliformis]|nr:putative oxidoreductase [Xylaria flabelliformis]
MAPIRVGIIGLRPKPEGNPDVSGQPGYWAANAHLPGLLEMPEDYKIVAVCNSNLDSSTRAIKQYSLPESTKAYADPKDLANDPNVDFVVVSVNVGKHLELAKPALEKKKHVFVEWPLGAGMAATEELVKLADAAGVRTSVGVQARADPLILKTKEIVKSGKLGKITSSSAWISSAMYGLDAWMEGAEYYLDHKSGGNIFFIYFGHFLDSFIHVLGDFTEVQAILKKTVNEVPIFNPQGKLVNPGYLKTSPDQMLVQGVLESDAVASIQVRKPKIEADGVAFRWLISGTEGELEVIIPNTGFGSNWQFGDTQRTLRLRVGNDEAQNVDFLANDEFEGKVPTSAANVARQYRAFAKGGEQEAVATFNSALRSHKLLDRIIKAAGWESV